MIRKFACSFAFVLLIAPLLVRADPVGGNGSFPVGGGVSSGINTGQYNASPAPLTSGSYGPLLVDQYLQPILSPQSVIQAYTCVSSINPVAVGDLSPTRCRTDNLGDAYVIFNGAQPITPATTGVIGSRTTVIAYAGTSQLLMSSNPNRHGFMLQNQSTANEYVDDTGENTSGSSTPPADSLIISPGQLYETPTFYAPKGSILIWGPYAGQQFWAREY